jgi:hypothetical protein
MSCSRKGEQTFPQLLRSIHTTNIQKVENPGSAFPVNTDLNKKGLYTCFANVIGNDNDFIYDIICRSDGEPKFPLVAELLSEESLHQEYTPIINEGY